jgi:hypothetical protein
LLTSFAKVEKLKSAVKLLPDSPNLMLREVMNNLFLLIYHEGGEGERFMFNDARLVHWKINNNDTLDRFERVFILFPS